MNTFKVNIVSNEQICSDTYKMVMYCPDAFLNEFKPGQFIHIELPNAKDMILRRPISVHDTGDDTLTIVYKVLGKGTELMSQLKTHDIIDILGPIGNGFTLPEEAKTVFIVGGGLGCAPLLPIPSIDCMKEYYAFFGFGTKDMVYGVEEMEAVCEKCFVATDDGSFGHKGNSVQIMEKFMDTKKPDVIVACGPVPMIKGLKALAEKHNIPCYVSLEERMGCGYGSCLCCVCKTKNGEEEQYCRVCVDGPVFDVNEVVFDD